jgi:hypothetical protein
MDGIIRVRTAAWFATAVVVSVFATLLVMQEWRADAASGDSDATWVAVEPCRLFDQRPGKEPLGGKKTPLAAGSPATQQVTGNVGDCTIPTSGVVAVSMNVTIVSPTAQSNLRLYPADAASEPVVSNLNWLAGDSATPNKVDVKLSSTGAVKIAVANGTVNVLGDVVGYYTDTSLKELDTRVTSLEAKAGPGVLPSGKTLTGVYSVTGVATAADQYADSPISFGYQFASAPSVVVVGISDTPTQAAAAGCPGTAADPKADPGKVCVYEMARENTALLAGTGTLVEAGGAAAQVGGYKPANTPWGTATKYGTIVEASSAAAGQFASNGTWAATSP